MRSAVILVAILALAAAAPGGAQTLPTCDGGRFDIQGMPLVVNGASGSDFLTVGLNGPLGSRAWFVETSACAIVSMNVRTSKKVVRVRGLWLSCGGVAGPHRLNAVISPTACDTMTGKLKTRGVRGTRLFTATRHVDTIVGGPQDTFDLIQQRIFGTHGCNVSTCHGVFAQANLDLRAGAAYGSLIDAPATMAPGKTRVVPGDAASSFLAQKVHGTQAAGEGSQMPLIGTLLTQTELDLVDVWINAGAPQTGVVAGAPTLPPLQYTPAQPLPPPPGGYQIVLDGPWLQPGQEQEGCYWVPAPNGADFNVGRWEYSLNPGTHHFAVYTNRIPNPQVGVWLAGDFGCFNEATFGQSMSGAPQAPYFVDSYPSGIARVLKAGTYIGLNAHYRNDFDVPIQMKVWTNIYPFSGTPAHTAQTLTSLDTTFGISVPPFTQKTQFGRFTNSLGVPMSFITMSGHMHKRGLRFTVYKSDGSKLYENFDWAHPLGVLFNPPFVLAPGDFVNYECLHDNGVTRAVKKDSLGNPITLVFGVTTDDEMCILPGTYYTD